MTDYRIESFSGQEIVPWIRSLARLRINVFREFPYLYDGSLEYEETYLKTYVNSSMSRIFIAFFNDEVVGASSCLPMSDEVTEIQEPFLKHNFPVDKIVYFGESILLKEHRGQGLGKEFFRLREDYASRLITDLKYTTFCAVKRSENHPLRPPEYRSLEGLWERKGYTRDQDLICYFKWKDIDKEKEDKKPLVFWLKKWGTEGE